MTDPTAITTDSFDAVAYLLSRGAVTPNRAIEVGNIPSLVPATWNALVMCDLIRESSPGSGRFYLADNTPSTSQTLISRAKTVGVVLLVILIPLIAIVVTRAAQPR